jgi:hypothetical protein
VSAEVDNLLAILAAKAGFEVVTTSGSASSLRLLGRVPPAKQAALLAMYRHLNICARGADWSVDTSKLYFTPEPDNAQFCAWRFIFQSQGALPITAITLAANRVVEPQQSGQGALDEIRLPFTSKESYAKGKGSRMAGAPR